ncbi:MAG: class I adenylate cyclase [Thiohalomonadaceae bacterium]
MSKSTALYDDGNIDFRAVRHRFMKLNQARLERVREALRGRRCNVLEVLPLLFHINHAMFPGFVSKETPAGIIDYSPARHELEAGKRLARSFEYKTLRQRHFPILALYLIGSPGSIGYADDSDFDIWLCHDHNLSATELAYLQQKANAVETWAASLDMEVHFYLVNVERFRSGEVLPLSNNSSGSAQYNLLLEEFYRTSILLAGQAPLWWVVPPAHESDYDDYVQNLKQKRFPHARGLLDLGGLSFIPAEEFLGAALWHLYKSIDSPYKAVLKLLLIESYAYDYPHFDLNSLRFKQAIYRGDDQVDRLDPYLMMMQKIEEYLQRKNDHARLRFARRAFYFKTNERLNETPNNTSWQHDLLRSVFKQWGWQPLDVEQMNRRDKWKVARVAEEQRLVFEILSVSYRFLSDFVRAHAGLSLISQRDLTVLGRKLYAAFERKAGKIELLNRGINANLHESSVTIVELLDEHQQGGWQLYQGALSKEEMRQSVPLKRARTLIELVAWAYFNGIVDRHSVLAIYPQVTQINSQELKLIVEHMQVSFPPSCLETRTLDEYSTPARIANAVLYTNNELDAFTSLSLGKTISCGQTDALNYGGIGKNLVQSMDLVIVTSWREVLTFHYRRGKGLMDFLCEYFKWTPPSRGESPPAIEIFGISAQRGHTAAQRIEKLLHELVATWYGTHAMPEARYLLTVSRGYYLVYFQAESLHYEALPDDDSLYAALGRSADSFRPLVFDSQSLTDSALPHIYSHNRSGWVQFFYLPNEDMANIFILDERGSLFHDRVPFFDGRVLLNQYGRFFEAVLNRMAFLMQEGQHMQTIAGVEFFQLSRDVRGHYHLERQKAEFRYDLQQYFSLQAIVDQVENSQTMFTLYCDEREFSSLEYGDNLLHAVVQHVLELRNNEQNYPIYITDIGLSHTVLGEQTNSRIQTIHFLHYKRRIEREMNSVLQQHT